MAETAQQRVDRIVEELIEGQRTFDQVRTSIYGQAGRAWSPDANIGTNDQAILAQARAGNWAPLYRRVADIFIHQGVFIGNGPLFSRTGPNQGNNGPNPTGPHQPPGTYPAGGPPAGQPGSDEPAEPGSFDEGGFALLERTLNDYGLGELVGWAREQIIAGHSPDWIMLELRNQPAFRTRFAAIFARQDAGLNPISPDDVLAFETQARNLMRAAGMPSGFYDNPDDFVRLLGNDVSVMELADRINKGYLEVASADVSVRQAFASMFGPSGDAALAAMFLDPDAALPVLLREVGAAQFGGAGLRFGFNIDTATALRASDLGLGPNAGQGMAMLSDMRPLFTETVGEREDLRAEVEGVSSVFNMGQEGRDATKRRKATRLANFEGDSGAAVTRGGVRGLASAD